MIDFLGIKTEVPEVPDSTLNNTVDPAVRKLTPHGPVKSIKETFSTMISLAQVQPMFVRK